jgi:hypothetical protein
MRRWPMSDAPRDGTAIVGCTRVEGVEHLIRWEGGQGEWREAQSGRPLPSDLFVSWRRDHRPL